MAFFVTSNEIVDAMQGVSLSGNVIPAIWYQRITRENGKPHLLAINLLADIVYWYRPTEIRDEQTGALCGYKKKFSADLLQRSYSDIAEFFGCSKVEATRAVVTLEQLGLIQREFRTIVINGVRCNNVLFIKLFPERLKAITGIDDSYPQKCIDLSTQKLTGVGANVDTNTKNTSETTQKTTQKKGSKKEPLKSFDELIDEYTENAELRGALRDYVQMRTAIRKKMTNRALELAFKELDKLASSDWDKVAIVNQSVMNSWQGLFPLKGNQPQSGYEADRKRALDENKKQWANLPGMKVI